MPHFETELPEVIVKPGKMISTSRLKALVVVVALLLYVYLIMVTKTSYLKSKRLDRIMKMALETEKKMLNIHNMDHNLAMKIAHVEKFYEDY